ncbi:ImmA/IrrE family metallo-endopeptidase, partial [Candidatus Sumerlaeota bacterium]|nr:ImmA/IrrE family metallo-endopeptidase [Candidatus Sumerlaeota bacterium]
MNRISVNPKLLQWARERADIPIHILVRSFPKYELWEKTQASPTMNQLEQLAKKTYTPLGCFFLSEPPIEKLPIPDFRTLKDGMPIRPTPNLFDTIRIIQHRQNWLREYLIEQGEDTLPFIESVKLSDRIEDVTTRIRNALGLPMDWAEKEKTWTDSLVKLRNAIEKTGILTTFNGVVGNNTHRHLNVEEFRGFVLIDEYAPFIFVNSSDAKAAQIFTLAHELAHIWLGVGGVFNLRQMQPSDNEAEIFCNQVAAEFLVPKDAIKPKWKDVRTKENPFNELARIFKVSPLVISRRALDLGLISKNRFFEFYNEYMENAE